jgi:hypothetical protein
LIKIQDALCVKFIELSSQIASFRLSHTISSSTELFGNISTKESCKVSLKKHGSEIWLYQVSSYQSKESKIKRIFALIIYP